MPKELILGIETSCDDTSIAILEGNDGESSILALSQFSQEVLLKTWGGVVPEIAARFHLAKICPLIQQVLDHSQLTFSDLTAVGVTTKPGLLGPLLTGLNAAKTICMINELPLIPVNHLYAHVEAIHLTEKVNYPYLGLCVSGGHTLFFLVKSPTDMEVLGSTMDDAAGEAFDKGGKMLGLGYPAGKIIDDLAKEGDPLRFEFPIGLKGSKNATMSFSGLKTSLRQWIHKNEAPAADDQKMKDLCASYQKAIVDAIALKTRYAKALAKEKTGLDLPIVMGGGVACNSALRSGLKEKYGNVYYVAPKYCTDNGAMIANYAYRAKAELEIPYPKCLEVDARGRFIDRGEQLIKARKESRP